MFMMLAAIAQRQNCNVTYLEVLCNIISNIKLCLHQWTCCVMCVMCDAADDDDDDVYHRNTHHY
jgi:hypothetical protein